MVPDEAIAQIRCSNPPVVILSDTHGSTCYSTPVTVNGNTFGGSATLVTITENGAGHVVASQATTSPFSFTYIPAPDDQGKTITITIRTNNPSGSPCKAARATYALDVTSVLSPPLIENISQPTCSVSTGSVELNGLPGGTGWTVTILPDGLSVSGNETSATIGYLSTGTYTFTVSTSDQCVSHASQPAIIYDQPPSPPPPVADHITPPTCAETTGTVTFTGLPQNGIWTLIRYPGTITQTGSGSSYSVSDIPPGTYNFTVKNFVGCLSGLSADIIMPDVQSGPPAPVIEHVFQPFGGNIYGGALLTGLPSEGKWKLIQLPDNKTYKGSGSAFTVNDLAPGTYTFKVVDSNGCTSDESDTAVIVIPSPPVVIVNDPSPVCFPSTANLTAPSVTEGSDPGLVFTYWSDESATDALEDPSSVTAGTYYVKGTSGSGTFVIKAVTVSVSMPLYAQAGPDQTIGYSHSTELSAQLEDGETGEWVVEKGTGIISDQSDPHSDVSRLSEGENIFCWVISNKVCPADTDKVIIKTGELEISTLITPNGDHRNDCFVIRGIESLRQTELTIFDRNGNLIFRKSNYDNSWNGIDKNDKPVVNDTYFFLLKSSGRDAINGYVVVRR
jgi:gliding motility-associated-like protein